MHLETIAERRDRLNREAIRRNAPAMRAEFWAGKAEGYQPERRAGPITIFPR
jgi:hypothetical protein